MISGAFVLFYDQNDLQKEAEEFDNYHFFYMPYYLSHVDMSSLTDKNLTDNKNTQESWFPFLRMDNSFTFDAF